MSQCPFGYGAPPAAANARVASSSAEEHRRFSVLGFETERNAGDDNFTNTADDSSRLCNYTDYIHTEALLSLQEGESIMKPEKKGMMHHEELLFIVTHQSIELWFKVLLRDLHKGHQMLVDSYSPEQESHGFSSWKNLEVVGQYLRRATMIFHHSADTFAVLQTMHPADFLEFRDFLVPASGFQSFQFRQIEILLGTNEAERAMCNDEHVFNALHENQKKDCETQISEGKSLKVAIEDLLLNVNVPDNFMGEFVKATEELHIARQTGLAHHTTDKARELAKEAVLQVTSVLDAPNTNMPADNPAQARAKKVMEAALYVTSYRAEHPHFAALSGIMDELIAVEEGLLLFRARHLHNVERVIGRRAGTGGSSGVEYLERTRHYRIFTVLWSLRQVFIRSSILPSLSKLHGGKSIGDIILFTEKPGH